MTWYAFSLIAVFAGVALAMFDSIMHPNGTVIGVLGAWLFVPGTLFLVGLLMNDAIVWMYG